MFSVDYIHKSQDAQSWNLVNIVRYIRYVLYINIIEFCVSRQGNKTGTKSIF